MTDTSNNKNDIVITEEFSQALQIIEEGDKHLFISGRAGTGKSTFLQLLRKRVRKSMVVVAPTGVAALNVRGQTIHSLFGLPFGIISLQQIGKKRYNRRLYSAIELLVIDEISMVRADVFDAIEKFLRLNGPEPGMPFGGVQLCMIGDLFQLPPVVTQSESAEFYQRYENSFFFCSNAYRDYKDRFAHIAFSRVFRQSDQDFIECLNRIRFGVATEDDFEMLNDKYNPDIDFVSLENDPANRNPAMVLTATNKIADMINETKLEEIAEEARIYQGAATGKFALSEQRLPAPLELKLKIGAQVMFCKNDPEFRWVNGSLGRVVGMKEKSVEVQLYGSGSGQIHEVERVKWENIAYNWNEAEEEMQEDVIGRYRQLPLIPAWAITIHKSQGKSLDRVVLDLGQGAFAAGQLYVALSRCRSLGGLTLSRPISADDMIVSKPALDFIVALNDELVS